MHRASGPPYRNTTQRGNACAYSPGGCGCALLMFPVVAAGAGIAIVFAGMAAVALICLVVAMGFTAYFAATAKTRREQGRALGGWVAIPIVLYAISIPYLLFFWWLMSPPT